MNGSEILQIILLCQNEDHSIVTVATTRMNLMQEEHLFNKENSCNEEVFENKRQKVCQTDRVIL